jgi:hypothetical protein
MRSRYPRRAVKRIRKIPPEERTKREARYLAEYDAGSGYRWCWWHQAIHAESKFYRNVNGKNGIDWSCKEGRGDLAKLAHYKSRVELKESVT